MNPTLILQLLACSPKMPSADSADFGDDHQPAENSLKDLMVLAANTPKNLVPEANSETTFDFNDSENSSAESQAHDGRLAIIEYNNWMQFWMASDFWQSYFPNQISFLPEHSDNMTPDLFADVLSEMPEDLPFVADVERLEVSDQFGERIEFSLQIYVGAGQDQGVDFSHSLSFEGAYVLTETSERIFMSSSYSSLREEGYYYVISLHTESLLSEDESSVRITNYRRDFEYSDQEAFEFSEELYHVHRERFQAVDDFILSLILASGLDPNQTEQSFRYDSNQ